MTRHPSHIPAPERRYAPPVTPAREAPRLVLLPAALAGATLGVLDALSRAWWGIDVPGWAAAWLLGWL